MFELPVYPLQQLNKKNTAKAWPNLFLSEMSMNLNSRHAVFMVILLIQDLIQWQRRSKSLGYLS